MNLAHPSPDWPGPVSRDRRRSLATIGVGLALLALAPARGLASDVADVSDHERARAALARGEILPLASLLERIAPQHPGEVLEVELERAAGRWVYELKLLQPGGGLRKLLVDARNAEVLRMKERGPRRERDRDEQDRRGRR